MLLVHTTDLFRTVLRYSCKRLLWLSRIAPEIGSTNERVALTGSRPNRRWTFGPGGGGELSRPSQATKIFHTNCRLLQLSFILNFIQYSYSMAWLAALRPTTESACTRRIGALRVKPYFRAFFRLQSYKSHQISNLTIQLVVSLFPYGVYSDCHVSDFRVGRLLRYDSMYDEVSFACFSGVFRFKALLV